MFVRRYLYTDAFAGKAAEGTTRRGMKSINYLAMVLFVMVSVVVRGESRAETAGTLHWVGSWPASQQIPETANLLDPELMRDATLRQIVHLSVGGSQLRVRLSNAFGT